MILGWLEAGEGSRQSRIEGLAAMTDGQTESGGHGGQAGHRHHDGRNCSGRLAVEGVAADRGGRAFGAPLDDDGLRAPAYRSVACGRGTVWDLAGRSYSRHDGHQ